MHINVFRLFSRCLPLSFSFSLFRSSPRFPPFSVALALALFLALIFLLLYFFSPDRALFYLALALLSRAVFNFSSVCGREYISNLPGIGVNINERSIMNERKPRLDAVNQKRLSLGFVVSTSSRIYLAISRNSAMYLRLCAQDN